MDVNKDGQRNTDAKDYDTGANHVHNHGFKHEHEHISAVKEQEDKMPVHGHGHGHGHGMTGKGHNMDHMDHMQMQAFSLKTYSDFLIEGITISSIQGIILATIFTFAITVLLDCIKFMMQMREIQRGSDQNIQVLDQNKKHSWRLFATAIYHMLSVSLAYIMMLCVMTMNVWLMVSVVLGSGLAHLVMRPVLSWKLGLSEYPKERNIDRAIEEAEPLHHLNDRPRDHIRRTSSRKVLTVRKSSLLIEDTSYV